MSLDLPCGCTVGSATGYVHGLCERHLAAERTLPRIGRPYTVPELEAAAYRQETKLTITCPICQMTSYHPKDIVQGYCSNCHAWTSVGVSSPTDH